MKKIKVCFILPQALPVPAVKGGAVETLAESMAKYNEKYDYLDMTIVSLDDEAAVEKSKQYKKTSWIFIKKNKLDVYSDYIFRIIRRIFHKSLALGRYDYKVLKKIKDIKFDRVVFEGGNVFFAPHYHRFFDKESLLFHYHCIERPEFSIRMCVSGSIGISEYVTKVFEKCSDLKERNYTLLNGIEIDKFNRSENEEVADELRKKYGIAKEDFVLLYVGRLIAVKGIMETIQAVNHLKNLNIKLLVAGNGTGFNDSFVEELKKEIKKSDGKSILLGYVSNEELYKYYQISSCVIMPSICEEGAGLVQCEAYVAGKPVIVTNMGGIPEYRIKEASIEIEVSDDFSRKIEEAIRKMMESVQQGRFDSEKIKQEAMRFSAENYYLDYVNLLKEDMRIKE